MGVKSIDGSAQKHIYVFPLGACERSTGLHSASSKWQRIDQKVRPDWIQPSYSGHQSVFSLLRLSITVRY